MYKPPPGYMAAVTKKEKKEEEAPKLEDEVGKLLFVFDYFSLI